MGNDYVVNVAVDSWYPKGQDRLRDCLRDHGFSGSTSFSKSYAPHWPTHRQRPYAFKSYAIFDLDPFDPDVVVWLDSSIVVVNPIDKIIERAREHGACVWDSGWALGQWTKDEALAIYGVTRDEAMEIPLVVGGAFALDLTHDRGRNIFKRLFEYASHPSLFVGAWDNAAGNLGDSRCLGHRHDMPALTLACREYEADIIRDGSWFRYDAAPSNDDILIALGKGEL